MTRGGGAFSSQGGSQQFCAAAPGPARIWQLRLRGPPQTAVAVLPLIIVVVRWPETTLESVDDFIFFNDYDSLFFFVTPPPAPSPKPPHFLGVDAFFHTRGGD